MAYTVTVTSTIKSEEEDPRSAQEDAFAQIAVQLKNQVPFDKIFKVNIKSK